MNRITCIPDEKSLIDDTKATSLRYHNEASEKGSYCIQNHDLISISKPVEMPYGLFQPRVSLSEKPRHRERHQTRAER